jgi:hypothetical protein
LLLLRFHRKVEEAEQKRENDLWMFGALQATIANCLVGKEDKTVWTYKDFVSLKTDIKKEVTKEKLTLKKAKEALGSKFNLN